MYNRNVISEKSFSAQEHVPFKSKKGFLNSFCSIAKVYEF